jgi:hypothetical protein
MGPEAKRASCAYDFQKNSMGKLMRYAGGRVVSGAVSCTRVACFTRVEGRRQIDAKPYAKAGQVILEIPRHLKHSVKAVADDELGRQPGQHR